MRALLPYIGTVILLAFAAFGVSLAVQAQSNLEVSSLDRSSVSPEAPESAQETKSASSISLPRLRPAVYYEAIVERPLFSPTRRPFVPQAEAALEIEVEQQDGPQELSTPPDLVLLGAMGRAGNPIALLEHDGEPAEWFAEGEVFDGWSLSKIGSDWIAITDGNSEIRLDMFQ